MNILRQYFKLEIAKRESFRIFFRGSEYFIKQLTEAFYFAVDAEELANCRDINNLLKVRAIDGLESLKCWIDEIIEEFKNDKPQT